MRDKDTFGFSSSPHSNNNTDQAEFVTEGTCLRAVLVLASLYSRCLERVISGNEEQWEGESKEGK